MYVKDLVLLCKRKGPPGLRLAADVNEAPVISPVNVSFPESQANGTLLVPSINYVDQDSGDYTTFTLTRVRLT